MNTRLNTSGMADALIVLILAIVLLVIGFVGLNVFGSKFSEANYEFKEKYNQGSDGVNCAALSPECGYCAGVVNGGYCYWNKEDLDF